MKTLTLTFLGLFALSLTGFSQASEYNLESQNLHKKVIKTINHYYVYHEKSGGFVKQSVSINTYNNDGNLAESYYNYNSTYDGNSTTSSTLYKYNEKGQLISTEDSRGKSSGFYRFFYDDKGNLSKREYDYNGSVSETKYLYDNKDRLINSESFSSKGLLTNRTTISYNGSKRTEVSKNYSATDGSLYGTYTTYYKGDEKTNYTSESKYGNSNLTYKYDRKDNIIESLNKEKPDLSSYYTYEYDNKDNWVKQHYKSGNYHYFYFREILFNNGDVTGSTTFDKDFVNKSGKFNNVNVVSITPTKGTTTTTTTTTNTNSDMPVFTTKNWIFNYVNLDNKVSSLSGEVVLKVLDNSKMDQNSKVSISYSFGGKNYSDTYTVTSYLKTEEYGFWSLKSTTKTTTASVSIYHTKKYVEAKDLYLSGLIMLAFNGKNTSFYLE